MIYKISNYICEVYSPASGEIFNLAGLIAKDLGETIKEYIDGGKFGHAYKTESNKVLKITADLAELELAHKLSKNRNWSTNIVNYYNIGYIKFTKEVSSYLGKFIGYILMDEIINKISDKEKTIIDSIYQRYIRFTPRYSDFLELPVSEIIDDNQEDIKGKNINIQDIIELHPNIVELVKDAKTHKIKMLDFQASNLGWNSDHTKLIMFDLTGIFPHKK